jgi:hypothetical protein
MRLEILIDGMLAVHAKHAVFAALAAVGGVDGAEVELGRVELECARAEGELATVEAEIRAAIESAGFTVRAVKRLPRRLPTF